MKLLCDFLFERTIRQNIQELLGIDITKPNFSDTCCSVEHIYYPNPYDKFHTITTGVIGVICDDYILCRLSYKYEFDDKSNYEKCQIKIEEIFSEHFDLLGIKSPTLD